MTVSVPLAALGRTARWLAVVLALLGALPARAADDAAFAAAVAALDAAGFSAKAEAAGQLAQLGDPRAIAVLEAMSAGRLYSRQPATPPETGQTEPAPTEPGAGEPATTTPNPVVIAEPGDSGYLVTDPVTGRAIGTVDGAELSRIIVNNSLRRAIGAAIAQLAISDADPARRLAAAETIAEAGTPEAAATLRAALAKETDSQVRAALSLALARLSLGSTEASERLAAVEGLAAALTPETKALVEPLTRTNADGSFAEPNPEVRSAARKLITAIEWRLLATDLALNLFQGISLGSVLLLAAVGLAITFGVMGVINMAHGEMIMLGAYTAFVVQEAFRRWVPEDFFGLYLIVSIPAAFFVAGVIGIALERGIIRFLYGRPLETLLATWGISLVLQQVVRSIFGAPNREVSNPAWMTGAWDAMPGLVLTWNRISIILFALGVLVAIAAILRYTSFGLQMRAVTQNRPMAAAMGIPSGWVDALTFGLGSGIAGVAGVALSQVGNVSPNLGQTYIVDSFMVVVFGGVGSLWGVLAGAMSLGVVNKILEPYAGAMLGKILVLVLLILFIQKRPRGLFALRGRAAEA